VRQNRRPDGRLTGAQIVVAGGGWSTVSGARIESCLPIAASPRSACVPPAGADGRPHATGGVGGASRPRRASRSTLTDVAGRRNEARAQQSDAQRRCLCPLELNERLLRFAHLGRWSSAHLHRRSRAPARVRQTIALTSVSDGALRSLDAPPRPPVACGRRSAPDGETHAHRGRRCWAQSSPSSRMTRSTSLRRPSASERRRSARRGAYLGARRIACRHPYDRLHLGGDRTASGHPLLVGGYPLASHKGA